MSASNFYVDIEDVKMLDDKEIIARSNAMAWDPETDEYISIANIEYDIKEEVGEYIVVFSTANGTNIARSVYAKYEAGELNVKISVLIELKKIYQCTYDDFFAGLDKSTMS